MQQYRVNYTLLIGLIVGTLVCSGAVYGLWKFQIGRKSDVLLREAKKARDANDYRQAALYFGQYLSIHPENMPVRFEFANSELDLSESEKATFSDLGDTVKILEQMFRNPEVVKQPEAAALRKRLITLYGRDSIRNYSSALDHLNYLLNDDPKNAELQVLRAEYLAKSKNVDEAVKYSFQLIGYDPKKDAFDIKTATAPHDPKVYATLALLVRQQRKRIELSEKIADQMVEANPKSADAYLKRGQLRVLWGNLDGARADGDSALELKPEDNDVLLFMADLATRDEHYDKASEHVEKAKKLHPEEVQNYQAGAALELKQQMTGKPEDRKQHYEKALAQIQEGLKKVPDSKKVQLLFFETDLQIQAADSKGARETLQELQKAKNLRTEVIDYFDARILMAEAKWFPASEAFNKLRAKMGDFGREKIAEIDYNLGLCYENLGRYDQAAQQYELILQGDPQNEPAKAGVQRAKAAMGGSVAKESSNENSDEWQQLLRKEMEKPKEKRDFAKLDAAILKLAEVRKLDETTTKMFQAQVLMMREDFDGAAKRLSEARTLSPKSLPVQRMIVQLALANPKIGPQRAMEVWGKVSAQFGDQPALRVDKADILIQLNKDKQDKEPLKRELANLLVGIDSWTADQKVELWSNMASRYLMLGMADEGRQCLALSAENRPNELKLRLAMFAVALDLGDDAGMQEAQDKILQIVQDKSDSNWLYAEARRKLLLVRRGRLGVDSLGEIRKLAQQALDQRKDWHELYVLLAEVELLSNNTTLALEYYDKAEQLGRPMPQSVAAHIRLLVGSGRYAEAGKLIDRIPEAARQSLLGPLYSEILFRSNQVEAAVKQARAAAENDPTSAQNQYWYGQLLARSSQGSDVNKQRRGEIMAEAIAATQRATELQPEFPDAWFALINYYAIQGDMTQAQKAMRDAQLALSGDNLTAFLAISNEALHRWFDAETMYRELYETQPDDVARAHQLAAFYLGPIYQQPDRYTKATPLINQILHAGTDKKVTPSDPHLLWARRMAAKMLSNSREYPNLLKAEKLLTSNVSPDGNLLIEDKLDLSEILAPRPEPESRLKAMRLLEDVNRIQPLGPEAATQLAELYFLLGGFNTKYTEKIEEVIATYRNAPEPRIKYVNRLLNKGDAASLQKAIVHLNKLREIAPNDPNTFTLSVRLGSKTGKQQLVRDDLVRRLPNWADIKEVDGGMTQQLAMMAGLLIELGDLDSAEKIYTELAARNPAIVFDLVKFLGVYRDPDRAFAKLNEIASPANIKQVVETGQVVSRARRDKVGEKYDADIQRWLDSGLRENPDSIALLMTQADFYDLQKKYEEAAAVDRKMLASTDLTGERRAIVLNNLAFLLALDPTAKKGDDDFLKMINEAKDILGPNSDILDTRAMVYIAQKDYKSAIRDLELAVTDTPTASKYYHKARAHLLDGQNNAAIEAWKKAEELGLGRDSLNRMEFEQYEDMKNKIEQLRKRTVTQAEPLRKAG